MLAGAPGDYVAPANQTVVNLIPGGKLGGLTNLGQRVGLLINDQSNNKVWRYNPAALFNAESCFDTGIKTWIPENAAEYFGNGSMGLMNENFGLTMPTETNLAYSMAPTGSYVQGATASFVITITNVGSQAIPVGMSQHCGCYTVFGPGPPASVQALSFSGTGWHGTVIDGHPVARHFGGLAPGQSYPPLTFTFKIPTGATATHAGVVAEGYGPGEFEVSDNVAPLSVPTTVANPIQMFRTANFGDAHPVGDAADDADPAGDGIPNLMKFALDLEPNQPAVLDERVDFMIEDGKPVLDVARNPEAAAAGLNFIVEQTTNLADPNSWTPTGVSIDVNTDNRLKAKVSQPALNGAVFMRLKVVSP
jgi:hypothetical protein